MDDYEHPSHDSLAHGQPCSGCAHIAGITVDCDETCGALLEPKTLPEYQAALEHARNHSRLSGCSHGR